MAATPFSEQEEKHPFSDLAQAVSQQQRHAHPVENTAPEKVRNVFWVRGRGVTAEYLYPERLCG